MARLFTTAPKPGILSAAHQAYAEGRDLSAVRIYGPRYWPGGTSAKDVQRPEDMVSVVSDYTAGQPVTRAAVEAMMADVVAAARGATSSMDSGSTLVGVMTFGNGNPDDLDGNGVVVGNLGDSAVFVRTRTGQIKQLTVPQEDTAGVLAKGLGANLEAWDRRYDQATQAAYGPTVTTFTMRDLMNLGLGEGPYEIIVASDGLFQQADSMKGNFKETEQVKYGQAVQGAQERRVAHLYQSVGMNDAESLAAQALAEMSDDDISVIKFAIPPRNREHVAAFVCDGVAGHAGGADIAEAAIGAVNRVLGEIVRGLHARAPRTKVRGTPLDHRMVAGTAHPRRVLKPQVDTLFERPAPIPDTVPGAVDINAEARMTQRAGVAAAIGQVEAIVRREARRKPPRRAPRPSGHTARYDAAHGLSTAVADARRHLMLGAAGLPGQVRALERIAEVITRGGDPVVSRAGVVIAAGLVDGIEFTRTEHAAHPARTPALQPWMLARLEPGFLEAKAALPPAPQRRGWHFGGH